MDEVQQERFDKVWRFIGYSALVGIGLWFWLSGQADEPMTRGHGALLMVVFLAYGYHVYRLWTERHEALNRKIDYLLKEVASLHAQELHR